MRARSPETATVSEARMAAFHAVLAVLRGRGFVSERIARASFSEAREAAFARLLAQGAIRHVITIEHVLSQVARYDPYFVPLELRTILILAAYQLIWVDGVPPFAAVNEAVTHAQQLHGRRGGNLVNAILRNLARAIDQRVTAWHAGDCRMIRTSAAQACSFRMLVLPPTGDPVEHVAPHVGERTARFRELVERVGLERAEEIGWTCQRIPPLVLQPNPLRIDLAAFEKSVRQAWESAEIEAGAAFLPPTAALADSAMLREGQAYVQDVTARRAADLLAGHPGERILDLCAAPGGKSIALAVALQDRGEIIACDIAAERVERIAQNAARMRLSAIRPTLLAAHGPPSAAPRSATRSQSATAKPVSLESLGEFDAALLDVPCSNTGVIARRPEARLGLTQQKLDSLVALQTGLLARAARSVKTGGRMVYSTCSIEPVENEQIVGAFVSRHPAWRIVSQETQLPRSGERLSDWRDGGFAALLAQRAS